MTEDLHSSQLVSFGVFQVDLQAGELRKAGMKQKLTGQPFQVLAILLEHPGDVVTREDLQKRLWPDTFVDVDRSLNTAINKIREALGDSAENPRFVETLPRRGYRFIGETNGHRRRTERIVVRSHRLKTVGWIVAGAVCVIAAVLFYRGLLDVKKSEAMRSIPLTSYPGLELCPTFSPDGSQIAFAWNGGSDPAAKTFDLYVKVVDSENLLRLTHHPSEFVCPAWSPDGTQIAFHRLAGADSGLYVVPALGGPERMLKSTHIPFDISVPISWSPDGKWIAYVESLPPVADQRVFLFSLDTLQSMQIPHAPRCLHEGLPAFSHSGENLAYACMHGSRANAIYSVATSGGSPKLIVEYPDFTGGISWTTDDDRIVFSQEAPNVDELYEVVVASGSLHKLTLAHDASWPAISPKGEMLAYSVSSDNINIWRRDLAHPEAPAVKLISSTREQGSAQYSPDGKHIAFHSTREGANDVWISDADGGNLVRVSKFDDVGGSPRWSPDGSKIVFDLRRTDHGEVYIVNFTDLVPRKLNTDKSNIYLPSWSHDGQWIYFTSQETTGPRIYRCPATGGKASALSTAAAERAEESFDGKTLYFISRAVKAPLQSISFERPGTESIVDGLPPVWLHSLWTTAPGGIYFVPADSRRSLRYFDFATKRIRPIFEIQKDFNHGLSISPDGRWILYSQLDEVNSDIMLVQHFR
jgi:Tol biopolymer transport system component/DNA-binding winged helix-turn-helix (wHTH) protein